MLYWPEDGRPYVALGKLYSKQSKFDKARAAYERGCQATQGENPYIWQVCTLSPHLGKFKWLNNAGHLVHPLDS
jgi:hypothetical protein